MQRLGYGRLIVGLVASAVLIGISWIVLEYLVPSPPSRVTIATGRKGTTFDYFGERYRQRFASAGVELHVRETAGALENFQLLRDRNSNVQIAFLTGGISNRTQALCIFGIIDCWKFPTALKKSCSTVFLLQGLRHSDLYFMLRYHLDRTRSRLIEACREIQAKVQ